MSVLENSSSLFSALNFADRYQQWQWRWWLAEVGERDLLEWLTWLMIAAAGVTFVALQFFNLLPAYGRYASGALLPNFSLPARVAWTLQELPSVVIPLVAVWQNQETISLAGLSVVFLFTAHYFHRTFIYGSLIRGGKPTPFYLFALGVIFTTWNGYIQGFYHAKYAQFSPNHLYSFRAIFGVSIYLYGMVVNIHSDSILRNLRAPGETGYRIPRGGAFEFVSGANFYGEIVEWCGYALYAKSWTACAFCLYTISNTVPRAIEHHRWYLKKFEDYPKDRKAIIPFVL